MSYNTKDIPADSPTTKFMDVGIHDNVELVDIRFDKSPKAGNKFLVFTFKNEKGQELSHTEWEPRDNDETRKHQKGENQIKRIKHMAKRYMPVEEFDTVINDFDHLAQHVLKVFEDKYKGVKVRIKVIYSNSNYTSLPPYTPFIEKMSVPKEESELTILSIDKMVRDRADRETPVANPLDELTSTKTEDLPF